MNFTNEQLAKAKAAKSAKELFELAKESGFELTEEEAKKYFAIFHKDGDLADEELDNVAGGCHLPGDYTIMYCKECDWTTTWKGHYTHSMSYAGPCPKCGATLIYAGTYMG